MGGGGGGKGGGGGGATDTEASRTASELSKLLFGETTPGRQALEAQGLEALKTGGTAASIPSVQRAVESSKNTMADTMSQITGNFASSGLGGTPYAESTKANALMSGNLATNQSANAIGQWFMQMLPAFLTGQQQTGSQLLSSAGAQEAQLAAANTQAQSSKGNSMMGVLGAMIPRITYAI